MKFILPTKKLADLVIDNNFEDHLNNNIEKINKLTELFSKDKEKFKEQLKEKKIPNEFKLNSYQIYILGFITPIILYGIYYIIIRKFGLLK